MKSPKQAEFGDFQTPPSLAGRVCEHLVDRGVRPNSLLEPTCGRGAFLFAGLDAFPAIEQAIGAELNRQYVRQARATLRQRPDAAKGTIHQLDFFAADWRTLLAKLPEPILVLGNPPWVTNAELGILGSRNLPAKANSGELTGLDARTGKSNFDISEWMLVRLMESLSGRRGILAMLCKTSVARKVLAHGWKKQLPIAQASLHPINALRHFSAAVDATLLVAHFEPGGACAEASFEPLDADRPANASVTGKIGYEDGVLLADVAAYRRWRHLAASEPTPWRSGIKHDCSRVMELVRDESRPPFPSGLRNGLGELVEIEPELLFPLMKSSDLARGGTGGPQRWLLVPQCSIGEDTSELERRLPRTWAYLLKHAAALDRRASSIYRGRPRFSIFGVGGYSFSPWKVAISGFHKRLDFQAVGPRDGRPVVFDDTSYFLPCETEEHATCVVELLHSAPASEFLRSLLFWDSKRPVTAELLRRLDLRRVAEELGCLARLDATTPVAEVARLPTIARQMETQ